MRLIAGMVAALVAAAALGACTTEPPPVRASEPPSPLRACPATVASPRPNGPGTVPALTLPCFTGGAPVEVARLGRPAVINLWASWCAPCRAELPELQRFADAAGDRLIVLGVVTGDTRAAATAAAVDFGITFPAVFDPDEAVRRGLGLTGLPVTLFVDPQGRVRHVYSGEVLTMSTLEALAREHLGVVA